MDVEFSSNASRPTFGRRYPAFPRLSACGSTNTQGGTHRLGPFGRKQAGARRNRAALIPWSTEADRRATIRALRSQFIPCPKGLHKATYRRLLREHDRVLVELDRLQFRRTWA